MENRWIRSDLKNFVPYESVCRPYKYKLDANESPIGLLENVKKKLLQWIENEENLNVYPDSDSTVLREALGFFWNVSPENVICGVGSDQIIDYITKALLNTGDAVLVVSPTFSMYKVSALLNRGQVHEMEFEKDYTIDVQKISNYIEKSHIKMLFLCTPNNPTGLDFKKEDILKILDNCSVPVVIDEAYGEFNDVSLVNYINKYDNLIICRTFSKAYGLAGARVGYAIAHKELIEALNIVKAPFNLPTISQLLAVWVLEDSELYGLRMEYIIIQREQMSNKLKKFSWLKVYPSCANFLFIESKKEIVTYFEKRGVLTRKFPICDTDTNIIEKVRITVGNSQQNEFTYNLFLELDAL